MRYATTLFLAVVWAGLVGAQESCIPYVVEPCDGDPQQYECVNVTTALTDKLGGGHTQILQEFCFKPDSPLFNTITVTVNVGTLDLTVLHAGDVIGELMFAVKISDFSSTPCPVGDQATLRAPIVVAAVSDEFADVSVTITEASAPLATCVLRYNPLDTTHNEGRILTGTLAMLTGGGFEMYLELAELRTDLTPPAQYPGLEYGDLAGSGTPVPLYFNPLTRDDAYTLPATGGTLTVATLLNAANQSSVFVEKEFLEDFAITPGVVLPTFRRGDVNEDGKVDIADPVSLLGHLFSGKPMPNCPDAGDANNDGTLNIADAIKILGHLFAGTGPLPAPFGACGTESDGDTLPACNYKGGC
jgi:hypothetical protein